MADGDGTLLLRRAYRVVRMENDPKLTAMWNNIDQWLGLDGGTLQDEHREQVEMAWSLTVIRLDAKDYPGLKIEQMKTEVYKSGATLDLAAIPSNIVDTIQTLVKETNYRNLAHAAEKGRPMPSKSSDLSSDKPKHKSNGSFTWMDKIFTVLSFKTNRILLAPIPFITILLFVSLVEQLNPLEGLKEPYIQFWAVVSSAAAFCFLTFFYHFGMYVRRNWSERSYLRYTLSGIALFWMIGIPYSLIFGVYDLEDQEFWFIFLLLPVVIYSAIELYFQKIK